MQGCWAPARCTAPFSRMSKAERRAPERDTTAKRASSSVTPADLCSMPRSGGAFVDELGILPEDSMNRDVISCRPACRSTTVSCAKPGLRAKKICSATSAILRDLGRLTVVDQCWPVQLLQISVQTALLCTAVAALASST